MRSRTISNNNNPEFDEEFTMLVDDPNKQVISGILLKLAAAILFPCIGCSGCNLPWGG